MAQNKDSIASGNTRDKDLPVSPGFTNLPPMKDKRDLDKAAESVRQTRYQIDAAFRAIKEKLTPQHMRQVAVEAVRETMSDPSRRRSSIAVIASSVAGILLLIKSIRYIQSRRRQHK